MERTYFIYRTPMGRVAIESDGAAITHFAFGPVQLAGRQHATALTNRASSEVLEYLAGKRIAFEVPVRAEGSAFQRVFGQRFPKFPMARRVPMQKSQKALASPAPCRRWGKLVVETPSRCSFPAIEWLDQTENWVAMPLGQQ